MDTPNWESDDDILELDPPLELIEAQEVTGEVFERGCLLLEIDPDDVLAGREVELPKHPKLEHTWQFFELVVENSDEYNLAQMQVGRLKSVLAVAADHFMSAPLRR